MCRHKTVSFNSLSDTAFCFITIESLLINIILSEFPSQGDSFFETEPPPFKGREQTDWIQAP